MKPIRRNVWTTLLAFFFLVGVSAIPLAEAGVTGPGPTGPAGPSGPAPSGTGPVGVVAGVATAPSSCASGSIITWGTAPLCTTPNGTGAPLLATNNTQTNPTLTGTVKIGGSAGVLTTDASGVASAGIAPPVYGGTGLDNSASTGVLVWSAGTATPTATTGTGSVVRATSPTLVTPALGAATGTSLNTTGNIATDQLLASNRSGVGASVVDAVLIQNATAAALNAQQWSGALHYGAKGWGTTAGTSQVLDVRNYLVPVQGTTAPTYLLTWDGQVNGGGFVTLATLSNFGAFTASGSVTSQGSGLGTTPGDRVIAANGTAALVGTTVQITPSFRQSGNVWDTDDAVSRPFSWGTNAVPTSANTPTSTMHWFSANNGGADTDAMTLSSGGVLSTTGSISVVSGNVTANGGFLIASKNAIATTSTDTVIAQNTTAANVGTTIQYGGGLASNGAGWDTDDAVSRNVRFRCDTRPTSGTAVGGSFVCASSIDGAAYVDAMSLNTTGNTLLVGSGAGASSVQISSTSAAASADGLWLRNVNAASSGTQNRWSPRMHQTSQVWDGSAQQIVDWIDEQQTSSSGGASYSGDKVWSYQAAAGGYVEKMRLAGRTGTLTLPGPLALTNQSGTATLAAGTVTISTAAVSATSRVFFTLKDAANTSLTTTYECPSASRSTGTPGSFVCRANIAAGTINTADTSTFDWMVIN